MDDYLAMGTLLEDYIKAHLPDSPVQQLTTLGDIEQVTLRGHLICVAYAGESVVSEGPAETAIITQRWLTIVSVQSAARALDGKAPRAKMGPLLARLGRLVQGQQFQGGYKPMRRVTPPAPRQSGGFHHFPLAWETSIVIVGEGEAF